MQRGCPLTSYNITRIQNRVKIQISSSESWICTPHNSKLFQMVLQSMNIEFYFSRFTQHKLCTGRILLKYEMRVVWVLWNTKPPKYWSVVRLSMVKRETLQKKMRRHNHRIGKFWINNVQLYLTSFVTFSQDLHD